MKYRVWIFLGFVPFFLIGCRLFFGWHAWDSTGPFFRFVGVIAYCRWCIRRAKESGHRQTDDALRRHVNMIHPRELL
jgi:hypothetical protein